MEITIPFKTLLKWAPFSAPGKELLVATNKAPVQHKARGKGLLEPPFKVLGVLEGHQQGHHLPWAGRAPQVRGSIPALSEVKANPAGTASSLWECWACCWMWQRHSNRKLSERNKSAALSPAIKAVWENWICVCVFLKTQSPYMLILF